MQYKDNLLKSRKATVIKETTTPLRWQPLDSPWMTLNIDGAVKESQKADCGGLIRDDKGKVLLGFAKFLSKCKSFLTKLWVGLEGLKLVSNRNIQQIIIQTDFKEVFEAITTLKTFIFKNKLQIYTEKKKR